MTTNADYCLKIVSKLYADINSFNIALNAREKEGLVDDVAFAYGELTEISIAELLDVVEPQSGEIFYDLGSGAGKPVLWASVLYDWHKCCGIELIKGLCELSQKQAEKLINNHKVHNILLNKTFNIQFVNENFLNVDFSDANVILANATAYTPDLWSKIIEKFLTLAPGARIMVLTKSINLPEFERIHSGFYLMSWGMNSVNFYRKIL
jgi:hypothetical protein